LKAFDLGFDVLPKFIGKMRGWVWEGYHRDMGTYETYLQAQRDAVEFMGYFNHGRPAVFLDRDGTLIESVHYLSRPDQVKLVPDAAEAIKQLQAAGFACVLVTNQAAIGLGIITEQDLQAIHQALIEQLTSQGVKLDGIYYCPITSQIKDRTTVENYDRKPGPGMLFKAAKELQLDLTRSWMIGDMVSDILAGYHAHCEGLILIAGEKSAEIPPTIQYQHVTDLSMSIKYILASIKIHL
jgi:D-glycero-D-manno-heptose 1,7-bisphosphate phosphatase